MASSYLITLLLLQFVYVLKSQNNATRATPAPSSTSTTGYFTSEPSAIACSANYGFVYIESSSLTLSETLLSERTNYPPYAYSTAIIQSRVSLYANNERVSETVNNPCDTTTWTTPSSHYDNTIVLIPYTQTYDMLCTPQQWSLNLQQYGNTKAVLIANDKELPVVYTLSGDTSLPHPIIPTRMISKNSATKIINAITNTSQTVFATIDCLNDTLHPSIICMLDSSVMPRPENVILDGEYQEQANILVNDHPVWLKEGHTGPIPMWSHTDLFMWLTINHSTTNNPWRWVIGSDYNNENTITMECITNSTSYMDDPTLCGSNWYRNGIVQSNMSSHGGICDAGDVYVCVETPQTYFKTYFAGRYRQLHPNVHYYISQTSLMMTGIMGSLLQIYAGIADELILFLTLPISGIMNYYLLRYCHNKQQQEYQLLPTNNNEIYHHKHTRDTTPRHMKNKYVKKTTYHKKNNVKHHQNTSKHKHVHAVDDIVIV